MIALAVSDAGSPSAWRVAVSAGGASDCASVLAGATSSEGTATCAGASGPFRRCPLGPSMSFNLTTWPSSPTSFTRKSVNLDAGAVAWIVSLLAQSPSRSDHAFKREH